VVCVVILLSIKFLINSEVLLITNNVILFFNIYEGIFSTYWFYEKLGV